jgi:hypothetical protein
MLRQALLAASVAISSVVFLAPRAEVAAGTALKLDVPGLVREADLIFEGRVIASRASCDELGRIATEHTVSVDRTFLGEPFGTRTFTLPGGVLPDGRGMLIAGMPRIEVGEDALFFLSRPSANGVRMPVGLAQGKFKVARTPQGVAQLVRTQADLMLVDPATGAAQPASGWSALDYHETARAIEIAVAARLAATAGAR